MGQATAHDLGRLLVSAFERLAEHKGTEDNPDYDYALGVFVSVVKNYGHSNSATLNNFLERVWRQVRKDERRLDMPLENFQFTLDKWNEALHMLFCAAHDPIGDPGLGPGALDCWCERP